MKNFIYHNGSKIFYYVLFAISLIETPVVHFLLTIWLGSTVAWIVTILTALAIIYMIVDFYAMKNNPIMVDDDMLYFRLGNRTKADIKLSDIQSVTSLTSLDYAQRIKEQITQLTPSMETSTLIEFKEPVTFKGLFGKESEAKKIAIYLDKPSGFMKSVNL
ncbi:MAG: hypothetical protein L3J43_05510 [Sulfurovum sp.]|nr:hypothetical protein [Sulfurovum sp.]